jgi:hypothetical protein
VKKKLLTLAVLGLAAALSAQQAVASTHHVTAKTQRHVVSERARNANAYVPPPVITYPAAEAPYFPDEALSPPAGH